MKDKYILLGALLLLAAFALAGCQTAGPAQQTPPPAVAGTQAPCPTASPCPDCPTCPETAVENVPFEKEWAASPHADATSEAFTHWNEEDPKEVPANCAKCHSTPGYLDFLGEDGSAPGAVDNPAEVGTVITCQACHNNSTAALTSVVFPSGAEVTNLGPEARCMLCHQGRASKVQVDESLTKVGAAEDLDTVKADLSFINIHYYAAAATMYGTITKGGYEYEGKSYDSKFDHVKGYDTCVGCHNPHSLEPKVEACASCHQGVNSREDLRNIRMAGSLVDYDGDGDIEEGIASEIEGMQALLLQAMQAYANEKSGMAIAYNPAVYPYFVIDTNGDGQAGDDESNGDNQFKGWTGRLLKAGYNYQTSIKDPGQFAHGGKYIIELLYDSIEDLNSQLATPVDLSKAHRIDAGHFAGSEEAFRHWDGEGALVPADCAKCHSSTGLPTFMEEASRARDQVSGINIAVPAANGLNCATCHSDLTTFTRFAPAQVKFPSGAVLDIGSTDGNLCLECHQGRESKVSMDRAIAGADVANDDTVSEALAFRNPHYFAAGATLFGTQAKGAYEYDGQEYNGRFMHVESFDTCTECHDAHALTIRTEGCAACHGQIASVEDLQNIRMTEGDFDGDGNATEGMAGEVQTMHEQLFAAIQAYATDKAGTSIIYNTARYPYFFNDANANGEIDEGEEAFASWTPRLLRAAYNYQWVAKDPGAFAHNGTYILQVLYDSINDLGGDVAAMTRPAVEAPAATATPTP